MPEPAVELRGTLSTELDRWLADLVRLIEHDGPRPLENYALQNKSLVVRDLLSLAATRGRYATAELLHEARRRQIRTESPERLEGNLAVEPLLALARLLVNQDMSPGGSADALALFDLALAEAGTKPLSPDDRLILGEATARAGDPVALEEAAARLRLGRIDKSHLRLLAANVRNPFLGASAAGGVGPWLHELNRVFQGHDLEPLALAPGHEPPFDRLLCGPGSLVQDGPLVTVVVPTFDPGPRIETAMRAILSQSYRRLQILVMNDGSSPEESRRLRMWEERDPRVTVVELDENGGTYRARNVALASYAKGDLFTVHDDDDWSHPRKIETQVEHLLTNPGELANVSLQTRATSDLIFTRINSNPRLIQPSYSSLMFWADRVISELGFWDELSRAADAEFFNRIIAHTGRRTVSVGKVPLSFLRVRAGSLTAGEMARGYLDVRRRWYESAYRTWHHESTTSGASLRLAVGEVPRPFAAPSSMLAGSAGRHRPDVDIAYAADFRTVAPGSDVAQDIHTLLSSGLRVGLVHMDSPWERGGEPWEGGRALVSPTMLELSRHQGAEVLSLDEEVPAPMIVVADPRILLLAPDRPARRTAETVVVLLSGQCQWVEMVRERASAIFGCADVTLASPLPEQLRVGVSAALGSPDSTWWLPLVERTNRVPRDPRADVARVLVVGRAPKPPSAALRSRFATVDWADTCPEDRDLSAFDFVYVGENAGRGWARTVADALAQGLVVALPAAAVASFGDSPVYTSDDDIWPALERLWSDRRLYAERSGAGLAFARSELLATARTSRRVR